MSQGSRAAVFAKGALQKRMVTRAQAEECLSVARKIRKRGKPVAIEDVFVRKGYMTHAEASSIAKRVRAKATAAPGLALAPEDPECPSCHRDPGNGEDCFRCGAILATGLPGPRAIACGRCGNVVLKGTALCPVCARSVEAPRRLRGGGRGGGAKQFFDRVILLATLAGMGFFVYQHAFKEPDALPETGVEAPRTQHAALRQAQIALGKGDREAAAKLLRSALAEAPAGEERELRRALALVASPDVATRAAEAGLEADGSDPILRLRLAELAIAAGQPKVASEHLSHVARAERDDRVWRLLAKARRASGEEWIEALLEVQRRTPVEARQLALALVERGRGHRKNKRQPQALRDLRRARQVDPDLAVAHLSLGLTLLEAGELEDARVSLRRAVQLDSAPAAPWLALGLVMERKGNVEAARANYQQFLRLARGEGGHQARISAVQARLEALSPKQ